MKVYGNTELMTALSQMVESGHIPHAMLLHQDDGGGAFPLVIHFLEQLYGGNPRVDKLIHPDIHFVFPVAGADKPVSLQYLAPFRELVLQTPYFYENELYSAIGIEGKQAGISVNEARSILDRLSLSAVEGGYRAVVLYLPEKMNVQAANASLLQGLCHDFCRNARNLDVHLEACDSVLCSGNLKVHVAKVVFFSQDV